MLLLPVILLAGSLAASAIHTEESRPGQPQEQTPFNSNDKNEIYCSTESLNIDHELATDETKTIYQSLVASDKFTKLVKVINISDEIVSLLNDTSAGIAFFAVPDWVLQGRHPHEKPPPHKPKEPKEPKEPREPKKPRLPRLPGMPKPPDPPHQHEKLHALPDTKFHWGPSQSKEPPQISLAANSGLGDLKAVYDQVEQYERVTLMSDESDEEKEKKKKIIAVIARAILAYHILPGGLTAAQLAENTTFATNLSIPATGPLRVRSSKGWGGAINLNFVSRVVKADLPAKNGIIHVINHPLHPPLSIFETLFFFPKYFSTLTSALGRVNLSHFLEYRFEKHPSSKDGKWKIEGNSAVTFFAPSNKAFAKLPRRLQFFLFSPFGEHVLKKLLAYHVISGFVLHHDYAHNFTDAKSIKISSNPGCHHKPPTFSANYTLPTLLPNASVRAWIGTWKTELPIPIPGHGKPTLYKRKMFVNYQPVLIEDGVARNGVIHVIGHLLHPLHHHPHHNATVGAAEKERLSWENWEDWLPQWADEQEI